LQRKESLEVGLIYVICHWQIAFIIRTGGVEDTGKSREGVDLISWKSRGWVDKIAWKSRGRVDKIAWKSRGGVDKIAWKSRGRGR
jgi:hypothetical protein